MNGRLIAGITFQVVQLLALVLIGLIVLIRNMNLTVDMLAIGIGAILLFGLNILSIVLIIRGISKDK